MKIRIILSTLCMLLSGCIFLPQNIKMQPILIKDDSNKTSSSEILLKDIPKTITGEIISTGNNINTTNLGIIFSSGSKINSGNTITTGSKLK